MQAASVTSIEKNVDRLASALLAAACGYAAYVWVGLRIDQPAPGAAATAAFAYLLGLIVLSAVEPKARKLPVPIFDVREVEPIEDAEALSTEPAEPAHPAGGEPLLLDDILAELAPESRVVRLFDPAAMPSAGELKSRIDRHLDRESSDARSSDAAQALHDALAELRRSIR
jgi:hypothetical protein